MSTESMPKALYIYHLTKETKMKQLIAIIMTAFALTAFAAEPSTAPSGATAPAPAKDGKLKLAKKKDHSKDKKVKKDATKSPSKSSK
jgi:hypothetical protein